MKTETKYICTSDNIKLSGLLHLPDVSRPPIVIMVHGFAGNRDENGLFLDISKRFVKNGIAVFRYDCRGIGQSEGNYQQITIDTMVQDFRDVLFSILGDKRLSKNISVLGFSLGATIAILGYTSWIRSLILWSPVFFPDIDMFPRYDTEEIRERFDTCGYIEKTNARVGRQLVRDFKNCATLDRIKSIHTPVIIFHGKDDRRINVNSTRKALNLIPGNVNFFEVSGEGHTFSKYFVNRLKIYDNTVNYLKKSMKRNFVTRPKPKKRDAQPPLFKVAS